MDKFISNLIGGDKKSSSKSKKEDNAKNEAWQGGRSGDMESIRKKNDVGKDVNPTNVKGGNIFTNAGEALVKMDLFKSNSSADKRGQGRSLGGSKPGHVFSVSLDEPGPLGLEVERRKDALGTTIISSVLPNSQSDRAGLKRGDIVCHLGSNGDNEYQYHQFVELAKAGTRPLKFDARRIESSLTHRSSGANAMGKDTASADAIHRKQAMIAAAEAREAKNKIKSKPISKSSESLKKAFDSRVDLYESKESEETRRAVEAAKLVERNNVENLGYNPYESKAMNSGQARTATVAMTCGVIAAENAPSKLKGGNGTSAAPGVVTAPCNAITKVSSDFEHAFSILVTSNSNQPAVVKALGTMRKLIVNAITKGQQGDDEESSKFRRVRLSNQKIRESITDMLGALELMMSVGFILSENEEHETYLVYPPGESGPEWLHDALEQMEMYERDG